MANDCGACVTQADDYGKPCVWCSGSCYESSMAPCSAENCVANHATSAFTVICCFILLPCVILCCCGALIGGIFHLYQKQQREKRQTVYHPVGPAQHGSYKPPAAAPVATVPATTAPVPPTVVTQAPVAAPAGKEDTADSKV